MPRRVRGRSGPPRGAARAQRPGRPARQRRAGPPRPGAIAPSRPGRDCRPVPTHGPPRPRPPAGRAHGAAPRTLVRSQGEPLPRRDSTHPTGRRWTASLIPPPAGRRRLARGRRQRPRWRVARARPPRSRPEPQGTLRPSGRRGPSPPSFEPPTSRVPPRSPHRRRRHATSRMTRPRGWLAPPTGDLERCAGRAGGDRACAPRAPRTSTRPRAWPT